MTKYKGCGIPLYIWIIGDLSLSILTFTFLLFIPCMFPRYFMHVRTLLIVWVLVFYWIHTGWIVWGYVIYFSDDNDCATKNYTRGWMIFMIILLFLGLITVIMAIILLFCLCCCKDRMFGDLGAL